MPRCFVQNTDTGSQAANTHVRGFPVISKILASSTKAQSSSLRTKVAKLLGSSRLQTQGKNTIHQGHGENSRAGQGILQNPLWRLLQATLEPRIGTKCPKNPTPPIHLYGPNESVLPNSLTSISPNLIIEEPFSFDGVLPRFSSDGDPECGHSFHSADDHLCQDGGMDEEYCPSSTRSQHVDDDGQELDESMLDLDESLSLPSYLLNEQCSSQQLQEPHQQQLTSEPMALDCFSDKEKQPRQPMEREHGMDLEYTDLASLPTSETISQYDDDYACYPSHSNKK